MNKFFRARSFWRILICITVLSVLVWCFGFLRFIESIPRITPENISEADAIIVLTGGTKRLTAGFELLLQGKAKRLFVSGVNANVGLQEIRTSSSNEAMLLSGDLLACCVELGFLAKDTRGNAIETAKWVKTRGVTSLVLVTSNYHMPRSQLELRLKLPEIAIIPYPVIAQAVMLEYWWHWPGSVQLLWLEYQKLILAGIHALFFPSNVTD